MLLMKFIGKFLRVNNMSVYLQDLELLKTDQDQLAAFESNSSTVVKAGPGSGKTTVLTLKVIQLLNEKIKKPRGLACITYSREAVREFTERLEEYKFKSGSNVFLGTVHSFCMAEIIAPFAHLYKYDIPLPLKIISEEQKKKIFNEIINQLNYDPKKISIIDMDKERNLIIEGLSEIIVENYDIALNVAKEYEKRIHSIGLIDFIDIVKYATLLIQNEPYVRLCLEAKFQWIMIDEYQDLGKPLHEMILSIIANTNIKIFAVGDSDQSIYGFNGAIPDYLYELSKSPKVLPIELKTNYRSHQDIIDASLEGLNQPERAYSAGRSFNKDAEFHFVSCEEELEDQYHAITYDIIPKCLEDGISLNEIGVLVKGKEQISEMKDFFEEGQIPYFVSRFDFKRTDFIIWIEKCAAWLVDKNSISFSIIAGFWIHLLRNHNYCKSSGEALDERVKLYSVLIKSESHVDNLFYWLEFVRNNLGFDLFLYDSDILPDEIRNLNTVINAAEDGELKNYTLDRFSKIGKPLNQVTLTTRHSSKGLEFEVVIILGLEKGSFPYYLNEKDPQKMDEERRLFFVCVSRAKRICYLLRSKKYTYNGRHGPFTTMKPPSIFWEELLSMSSLKKYKTDY